MSIFFLSNKNLFNSGAEALVNAVNCDGIMGAGIALQFKRRYPDCNTDYVQACRMGLVRPGFVHVYETGLSQPEPKYIVQFPTKDAVRLPSEMSYIRDGLVSLVHFILSSGVKSIAIPALGAGLGGLNWADVRREMVQALTQVEATVDVMIYEPLDSRP